MKVRVLRLHEHGLRVGVVVTRRTSARDAVRFPYPEQERSNNYVVQHDTRSTGPVGSFPTKGKKQEGIILYIFDQHPDGLSPWQTFRICNVSGARYPITSVRRAIT